MELRKVVVWLFLLVPLHGLAEEQRQSKLIGTWCSNPCSGGSTSRPREHPCTFEISKEEIRWSPSDDSQRKFVRKYSVIEQNQSEESFLVNGGGKREWYSSKSSQNAKHKLTFKIKHSNVYAQDSVELQESFWDEKSNNWQFSGSLYIQEGSCP